MFDWLKKLLPASVPSAEPKRRNFPAPKPTTPGREPCGPVAPAFPPLANRWDGRVLDVRTTEPSVHIFATARVRGETLSDVGKPFTLVPALAIETQHLPDSPNLPQYPSVILRPGETFHSTTIFTFRTDRKG